jgi:hypothetical protein
LNFRLDFLEEDLLVVYFLFHLIPNLDQNLRPILHLHQTDKE